MAVPEALEVADKLPQVAPLQPEPVSFHVTPLFCESFCTVAVIFAVFPVCTDALVRLTAMEIAGGADVVIVMVVAAVLEVFATEVAVNVTVAGEGAVAGAV